MKQIYRIQRHSKITLLFILIFFSCEKEQHPIPSLAVNIIINTDLPTYQPLNATGGWAYVEGGSRGIVVYNNFNEFIALDRHSTVNIEDPCSIVFVNPDNQLPKNGRH